MSSPSVNITTLSVAEAQQSLQSHGLDSLGLTALALSTRWTDTAVLAGSYDATTLTLNLGNVHAPFRGILEFAYSAVEGKLAKALGEGDTVLTLQSGQGASFPGPSGGGVLLTLQAQGSDKTETVLCTSRSGDDLTIGRHALDSTAQSFAAGDRVSLRLGGNTRSSHFAGADGEPLSGACAVFRLHPAALWRLETLMQARYAAPGNPLLFPVPRAMLVRGLAGYRTAQWFEPDDVLPAASGQISFHDRRGQIIDPVFVAGLFADLQNWLHGVTGKTSTQPVSAAGGLQGIASLASGTLVHVVDLHGSIFMPVVPSPALVTRNAADSITGNVPANGLLTLAAGDGIDSARTDDGRLRWGFATNGVLATQRLVPPAMPAAAVPAITLGRPFYRVAVIDTDWALLGNRTAATLQGIPGDDQKIPADLLPKVRDQVVIDYLVDGPDTLARSAAVLARPQQQMILAVSPQIDGSMSIPATAGPAAHWPQFPPVNTNAGFPSPLLSVKDKLTADWSAAQDVVVTIAANQVPDGAHIRIYPQQFVTIAAIGSQPSFLRGNGAATVAQAGKDSVILLPNPFALAGGQPRPDPAHLTMDIVVAPRSGKRKLWGGVSVTVTSNAVAAPPDLFGGSNVIGAMLPQTLSIAPVPLFGISTTVVAPGSAPGNLVAFVRALASEGVPRQGPRLPTMARFDTLVTTGTNGGLPSGSLLWEAVLSGGRWARETRSAQHAAGNPGNPAGPDVHAAGLHVTGGLAYDLARHAVRRTQPILPLPGSPGTQPGWVIGMGGDNFNEPSDSTAANTGCGVLLETVAAVCETPELSLLTPPAPGTTLQSVVNSIASSLGVMAPTVTAHNDVRLIGEIRREIVVSGAGLRDGLWALRRALRQARELIYIESPQFARTARPAGTPGPQEVDLVADIASSLTAHPQLKVVICTPREADFAASYPGWSRQHYQARTEAVANLLAVAPDRVVAFHPVGFPGRTAFIRSTSVIVDDVWALVGAMHFRRRGMSFDGSVAVASFDRQLDNGYSRNVRAFRRALMAAKLAVEAPFTGAPGADWMRLGSPEGCFELVRDWLAEGGLGQIQPLWPGPSDTTVLPATADMADPDGSNGGNFLSLLGGLITETGS